LIAARNERIQRERIAVGNGALFLDEDTEHARFQKGQDSEHGNWMIVGFRGTGVAYVKDRSAKAASPERSTRSVALPLHPSSAPMINELVGRTPRTPFRTIRLLCSRGHAAAAQGPRSALAQGVPACSVSDFISGALFAGRD